MTDLVKIEKTYVQLLGAVQVAVGLPDPKATKQSARAIGKFLKRNAKESPADIVGVALNKVGAVAGVFTEDEFAAFLEKAEGSIQLPTSMFPVLIANDNEEAISQEVDAYLASLPGGSSPDELRVKAVTLIRDSVFAIVAMELYALEHPPTNG